MKRITQYILFLFACYALSGCNAVEDRLDIGGFISADALKLTATPLIIDGKATNKIILNNESPVLSSWDYGTGVTQKKTDTVLVVLEGENEIIFTGRNPDGSEISKTLTVQVDELYFSVPPEWGYLTGGTDKEWEWAEGSVWGNGGYLANYAPAWWMLPEAEIDGQAKGEGTGAYMTFSLRGAAFSKTLSDGTTETGTYSFDMKKGSLADNGEVWSKGKITFKGTTILNGKSPDEGGIKVYEFDIIELDDNQMVLSYAPAGSTAWATAWFWVFKAKN